jgi:hypothetical protein
MKLKLTAVVGAVALAVAGEAFSATSGTVKAITLSPGMAVGYAGLTCTAYAGTTPMNGNLVCVRDNLVGFGVVVSQDQVIVAKAVRGKIHVYFKHTNA